MKWLFMVALAIVSCSVVAMEMDKEKDEGVAGKKEEIDSGLTNSLSNVQIKTAIFRDPLHHCKGDLKNCKGDLEDLKKISNQILPKWLVSVDDMYQQLKNKIDFKSGSTDYTWLEEFVIPSRIDMNNKDALAIQKLFVGFIISQQAKKDKKAEFLQFHHWTDLRSNCLLVFRDLFNHEVNNFYMQLHMNNSLETRLMNQVTRHRVVPDHNGSSTSVASLCEAMDSIKGISFDPLFGKKWHDWFSRTTNRPLTKFWSSEQQRKIMLHLAKMETLITDRKNNIELQKETNIKFKQEFCILTLYYIATHELMLLNQKLPAAGLSTVAKAGIGAALGVAGWGLYRYLTGGKKKQLNTHKEDFKKIIKN